MLFWLHGQEPSACGSWWIVFKKRGDVGRARWRTTRHHCAAGQRGGQAAGLDRGPRTSLGAERPVVARTGPNAIDLSRAVKGKLPATLKPQHALVSAPLAWRLDPEEQVRRLPHAAKLRTARRADHPQWLRPAQSRRTRACARRCPGRGSGAFHPTRHGLDAKHVSYFGDSLPNSCPSSA